MSIGLSVQEKMFKIDFQHGGSSGHLRFSIETILSFFFFFFFFFFFEGGGGRGEDLQVIPVLPIKF